MIDPVVPVTLPYAVDMAAVVLGAAQGALFAYGVAPQRRIDLIGVLMIGIATGMGGGIVRDILLNLEPVALTANRFIGAAVIASLVAVAFAGLIIKLDPLVVLFDAVSLGLYLVVGISKALDHQVGILPAVFVGILSCTAGSVIRDLLMGTEVQLVTVGSFYAFAAIGGAIVYLIGVRYATATEAAYAAVIITAAVRMLSIWFGWRTPHARALSLENTTLGKMTISGVEVITRTTRSGFMRSRRATGESPAARAADTKSSGGDAPSAG